MIDRTHDPAAQSWVESAQDRPEFPVQNLPLGVFAPADGGKPRIGTAIGDAILDLAALPIGYHGRASSVQVSGAPVIRPNSQTLAPGTILPAPAT